MDSILTFPPRFSASRYHAELYISLSGYFTYER